jgi:hypothetical protein
MIEESQSRSPHLQEMHQLALISDREGANPATRREEIAVKNHDFCTNLLDVRCVESNGLSTNAAPLLSLTRSGSHA